MRFVVYGAGAVGGIVGGCLHQHGHDVALVARGAHLDAIRRDGLILESPEGAEKLDIPAVADPADLDWGEPAVVVLAVKSQDTDGALEALASAAPPGTPVVCAQNGVENERRALRRFEHTYAMCVICAATHLRPGIVQVHFTPVSGLLDLGRYPSGVDDTAEAVAAALAGSTFDSRAVPDIMRWKYRKLIHNLTNAVDALCGTAGAGGEIARLAREEGEAVLRAAGIDDAATDEEDRVRWGTLVFGETWSMGATASGAWGGGSSWQSVVRSTGTVEADFLNGEVVLLGRLHGVPTPVNAVLGRRIAALARRHGTAGTVPADDLLAEIEAATAGDRRGV